MHFEFIMELWHDNYGKLARKTQLKSHFFDNNQKLQAVITLLSKLKKQKMSCKAGKLFKSKPVAESSKFILCHQRKPQCNLHSIN